MKGIIYYFSATGNTKWAANKFKDNFKKEDIVVEVKSMEKADNVELAGYDFIVIGTPVHAEAAPKFVMDFIDKLPEGQGMKAIVYSTQGANSAAAADIISDVLEKKGYTIMVQTYIKMSNNYYFGVGKEPTPEKITKNLTEAEKKISRVTSEFIKGNQYKNCVSLIRIAMGKITGKSFNRYLPKISTKLTSTDECTKCGLCLRNCPHKNITFENGHAVFHTYCMMCTRCIHICPKNAIRYKGKKIKQTQKSMIKALNLR